MTGRVEARWLGWAGVEIEADGTTVVIDPLGDAGAVYAPLGELGRSALLPSLAMPRAGAAVAALLTHLHRDHADARAVAGALAPSGVVLAPPSVGGDALENGAVAQADAELSEARMNPRPIEPWQTVDRDMFALTALPAVDGSGDPQISWLVEVRGRRILHLGDTMFHGYWWRIARRYGPFDAVFVPVNGAVLAFPHRQPSSPYPAMMTPDQAAVACEILGTRRAVAMHYGGFELEPFYRPRVRAEEQFLEAAEGRRFQPLVVEAGTTIDLA